MADQPPPSTAAPPNQPPPRPTTPPPALLIPGLPDDVALLCIARVPRLHHPFLSLVSKSWLSLLRSPFLFAARLRLRSTQHLLHLFVRLPSIPSFKFFALYQDSWVLVPLPPLPSPAARIGSAFAASGSKIYALGGSVNDIPSRAVWTFDARFNKWELGPPMRVGREFAAAGVVGGRVYVIGGCVVDTFARSANWAEVYDPQLGAWAALPCLLELREKWMHASAVVGGKIYAMADRGGVVFDPMAAAAGTGEAEWTGVSTELDMGWRGRAAVVGGVLYCYDYLGKIRGYDVDRDVWKELRGVEKGLPKFLCGATMANVGGRLFVVWEGKSSGKEMEILCAELEVRKDDDGELWGSIVRSNAILSVPAESAVVHCLAVEL